MMDAIRRQNNSLLLLLFPIPPHQSCNQEANHQTMSNDEDSYEYDYDEDEDVDDISGDGMDYEYDDDECENAKAEEDMALDKAADYYNCNSWLTTGEGEAIQVSAQKAMLVSKLEEHLLLSPILQRLLKPLRHDRVSFLYTIRDQVFGTRSMTVTGLRNFYQAVFEVPEDDIPQDAIDSLFQVPISRTHELNQIINTMISKNRESLGVTAPSDQSNSGSFQQVPPEQAGPPAGDAAIDGNAQDPSGKTYQVLQFSDTSRSAASPECLGACLSRPLPSYKYSDYVRLLEDVKTYCKSSAFQVFCADSGLTNASFTWGQDGSFNWGQDSVIGGTVCARFWKACQDVRVGMLNRSVAVVFHGTRQVNIKNILNNGLDEKKRSGQAYGPGEYFSTFPGTSTSYAHDNMMLVCLVIMPPIDTEMEKKHANKPLDYVVVSNSAHHLPVGVLSYSAVEQTVLARSKRERAMLTQLNKELLEKHVKAREAKAKADIIQLIIQGETELASCKFARSKSFLSEISQR
jgi:hypothetical protein